jgi:hypothetical protein
MMIKLDEKKLDALLENSLISCLGISSDYFGDRSCEKFDLARESFACAYCYLKNKQSIKEWLREEN